MFDPADNSQRKDAAWRPWDLFEAVEKNLFQSNLFNDFKTDIWEEGNIYILEAELPGFQKNEIFVTVEKDRLVIEAEHREEAEHTVHNGIYIKRERSAGLIRRVFDLAGMDTRHIEAFYNNGILRLVIPQKEEGASGATVLEIR